MAAEDYKAFVSDGVLGERVGVLRRRSFNLIAKTVPEQPVYDKKYFEAFPTSWASAYAFQRSIENGDESAIEQWLCLFILHYFGIAYVRRWTQEEIRQSFDPHLLQALQGTFPPSGGLAELRLLVTDDGVAIGGQYPEIVFFPDRDGSRLTASRSLLPYLENSALSWKMCKERLLRDAADKKEFYKHLRCIRDKWLRGNSLRSALGQLVGEEQGFNISTGDLEALDPDPDRWPVKGKLAPDKLLEMYPLRLREGSKMIYYLVKGMPSASGAWMDAPISPRCPTPRQYEKHTERTIRVRFRGEVIDCGIGEEDRIEHLEDLFLAVTQVCVLGRADKQHQSLIRSVHKVEITERRGVFAVGEVGDTMVCLAPFTIELLRRFPGLLANSERSVRLTVNRLDNKFEWALRLTDSLDANWSSGYEYRKRLPDSYLAMWPPRVSEDWRLYMA
ncbi:MAG: hypothetical protein ACREAC_24850, partial [Blastocatellia bacterium]